MTTAATTPSRGKGATRGKSAPELNRLRPEDRAVHDWYRFVLSFPSHLVRDYLDRFGVDSTQRVLDPFCGTGTTLVECKKLGIPSVGIERNPMAGFASRTKVDWNVDPEALVSHARKVADRALEQLREEGIDDLGVAPVSDGPATSYRARDVASGPLRSSAEELDQSAAPPQDARAARNAGAASPREVPRAREARPGDSFGASRSCAA